jgi:hypothetical protein
MTDPQDHCVDDLQELADTIAGWIIDAQLSIERLAAETGKRQEQTLAMEDDATDHAFLRIHFVCEPRQFATRTIEGEFADVAERALGGR